MEAVEEVAETAEEAVVRLYYNFACEDQLHSMLLVLYCKVVDLHLEEAEEIKGCWQSMSKFLIA